MSIGTRLKELRGDRTRETVAASVGVSSSALGMYENDWRVPRDDVKKRIAEFYGVSIQQLFYDD